MAINPATGSPSWTRPATTSWCSTYFNLGRATLYAPDASLTLRAAAPQGRLHRHLQLPEAAGGARRWSKSTVASEVEATALQQPRTKWTAGFHARDLGRWSGGAVLGVT